MKKNIAVLMLVAIVLGGLLAACERPAPLPATVPTETVGIPFPVGDKPTVPVGAISTQTAAAKPGGAVAPTAVPPKATVAVPTVKPTEPPAPKPTEAPAATATPKPVVVIKEPERPDNYTIQVGDTFYCVARRYNLNITELLGINGLGVNSLAQVGQTIKIPQAGESWQGSSRALHAHPDTYTVDAGDTLNKIACYYGDVYPEVILQANNLKNAADLKAGMKLTIP